MMKSIQMLLAATALVAVTGSVAMAADTTTTVGAGVSADVGTKGANGGVSADGTTTAGATTKADNTGSSASSTVTTDADGNIVLGTDATANASPDSYSKMTVQQKDNIKKTCAGKELGDKVMKDCKGFGLMQ